MSKDSCKCEFYSLKNKVYGSCLLKRFMKPINRLKNLASTRKQLEIKKQKRNKQKIQIKTQNKKP